MDLQVVITDMGRVGHPQRPVGGFLRRQPAELTGTNQDKLTLAALRHVEIIPAQHASDHASFQLGGRRLILLQTDKMIVDLHGGFAQGGGDRSWRAEVGVGGCPRKVIEQPWKQRFRGM